jgi:hypothetical protein
MNSVLLNQLEFPFFAEIVTKQKTRKPKISERAKDSEGRFATDNQIPDKQQFIEQETRREISVWMRLRQQQEEINRLNAEIKKLKGI